MGYLHLNITANDHKQLSNEGLGFKIQVMAGSGNLQVLRIARSLRRRVHADISYGTYLAVHMAIGFLFLGGGRYQNVSNHYRILYLICF